MLSDILQRGGRATRRSALWLALPVGLMACSPALDWRQVQPPGWSLVAALPCRPDTAERPVPLAGAPVLLMLWSCSVDGHLYAIASAELADPTRVGPALQALAAAASANLAAPAEPGLAASVPGMTPHAAARQLQLAGRRPDGQPLRAEVLVFAYGTRVYQATVLGPQASPALARPLFDALQVRR
ncbi:hypothetical protein [Aquabacterium sp. OR-4]|uniref:hypothetical protein n=1 Tax=Aquabacterium sp. OR-4 TaxID=2978127 RepID=UPI0021B21192|nr:hypothetical protein [Aquabacterium sp. OR-4]MDT7834277.1 hypothetical protein [Aquabacterium sp. OR-4]